MPMDVAPLICPNPVAAPPSGGGGFSIWSYMSAAIVASTVAAVPLQTQFFLLYTLKNLNFEGIGTHFLCSKKLCPKWFFNRILLRMSTATTTIITTMTTTTTKTSKIFQFHEKIMKLLSQFFLYTDSDDIHPNFGLVGLDQKSTQNYLGVKQCITLFTFGVLFL